MAKLVEGVCEALDVARSVIKEEETHHIICRSIERRQLKFAVTGAGANYNYN
jgi:hypothetical protein